MEHQICGTGKLSRRALMFLTPLSESRPQFHCARLYLWQLHPVQDCLCSKLQEDTFAFVLERRKPGYFARKGRTEYAAVWTTVVLCRNCCTRLPRAISKL
jgi:hypothetical protein